MIEDLVFLAQVRAPYHWCRRLARLETVKPEFPDFSNLRHTDYPTADSKAVPENGAAEARGIIRAVFRHLAIPGFGVHVFFPAKSSAWHP